MNTRPLEARFNEKYIPVTESGCYIWTGACRGNGEMLYGAIRVNGKDEGAHRVAWQMNKGPIPDGLCVLHKCDVPLCVNPEHLFLGTHMDNTADKIAKGRAKNLAGEAHPMHGKTHTSEVRKRLSEANRGEKCKFSKITEDDVRKIRKMYADGMRECEISKLYPRGIVIGVINNRTWRHVK